MGDFTKLGLKSEYRTRRDIVVEEFYIPCLENADVYKRSVGFFSSSILVKMAEGICSLAKRKKKMKLIVSTRISKEDYEAMENGYKLKEHNISNKMLDEFDSEFDEYSKNRLSLLAYLISIDCLEVKVAFLKGNNNIAMYHEKLGVMSDSEYNTVAFSGSANETENAVDHDFGNYETIDVFKSWEGDFQRCVDKENAFDRIWEGRDDAIITVDFPNVVKEKLLEFKPKNESEVETISNLDDYLKKTPTRLEDNTPTLGKIKLHYYQKEAVEKWKENNYIGVYDMATGTGKTFTGCASICELFKNRKRLVTVIVCPYTHLVEQWGKEVQKFGINPILGYSKSSLNWEKKFNRAVSNFQLELTDFVCLITTNITYCTEKVQSVLDEVYNDVLLVIDEAHNFGAMHLSKYLRKDFRYRLALSATLERYMDDDGTGKLLDYFQKKCITYTLQEAIANEFLTRYYYYPIPVYLSDGELEKYQELSEKILEECSRCNLKETDRQHMPERLKMLLIKRARIIAGSINKLEALKEVMQKYKNDKNLLVYCGATTIGDYGYDEDKTSTDDKRQIDEVIRILGVEMNMEVSPFTSNENIEERENIKSAYVNGDLQALIAIKCLDEGVDIPAIKTAFILASSTNPKEYIQRRGRVLRKFKGKKYAEIYDFITLPRDLNTVGTIAKGITDLEKSLVKREMARMMDFAEMADNSIDSFNLKEQICDAYKLDIIQGGIEDE